MLSVVTGLFGGAMRWMVRNPLPIIMMIMGVAITMVIVSKNAQISALEDDIHNPKNGYIARVDGLVADVTTYKNNTVTLQRSLERQNDGLQALNARAERADARGVAMLAALERSAGATATKLKALDAARPGTDKCVSAFDLVRSAVK